MRTGAAPPSAGSRLFLIKPQSFPAHRLTCALQRVSCSAQFQMRASVVEQIEGGSAAELRPQVAGPCQSYRCSKWRAPFPVAGVNCSRADQPVGQRPAFTHLRNALHRDDISPARLGTPHGRPPICRTHSISCGARSVRFGEARHREMQPGMLMAPPGFRWQTPP